MHSLTDYLLIFISSSGPNCASFCGAFFFPVSQAQHSQPIDTTYGQSFDDAHSRCSVWYV